MFAPSRSLILRLARGRSYGLFLLLSLLLIGDVRAQDLSYTTNNGTITITGYTGPGGVVSIPSAINNLPVTSLGLKAFQGTRLTSVAIPDSVTTIGESAFSACKNLTSVTIGNGVTEIGRYAFSDTALTSVILPNSVTSIGDAAFSSCIVLTNVTVGNSVTSIGGFAFSDTALKTVVIPNSVTTIGAAAFLNCSNLTSVAISEGVTFIGSVAFDGTPRLLSINVDPANLFYASVDGVLFDKSLTTLIKYPVGKVANSFAIPAGVTGIGEDAFHDCLLMSVTIPNSVTNIGAFAFSSSLLTSIAIPNSVTSMSVGVFFACKGLTKVTIGNGISNIGETTFESCVRLTTIIIPTSVTNIGGFAFSDTALKSVVIPDSVTGIGVDAFLRCTNLTSVAISKSVASIADDAFDGTIRLSSINVDPANLFYASVDGVLFDNSLTTLVKYPIGKVANSFAVPTGVTRIGDSAFRNCLLKGVTIPNSVTNIGAFTFSSCGITTVTIPNSVTSIGDAAFYACNQLTNATIGTGVVSIRNAMFQSCSKLISVSIPDGLTSIEANAFSLSSLVSIIIPNTVTNIANAAFSSCTSLTSLFFKGNAPPQNPGVFAGVTTATVYYLPGTTGWGSTFDGLPTAVWKLSAPEILNNDASFGIHTNRFSFTVFWATTNLNIVVEAATNLANPVWQPLKTNSLSGGTSYFSDPQWTNYSRRFYRVRSP